MSAANAEPDIANPTTADRTTFFMETPLFRPATAGEISIGAAKRQGQKASNCCLFRRNRHLSTKPRHKGVMCGTAATPVGRVGLCRLLAVGGEPLVDQRHGSVQRRVAHALLLAEELHQLVGALDVRRAVVE